MTDLPSAVNTEQTLLVAVCDRLDRLHALIDERLPGQAIQPNPTPADGPQPVKLREPEPVTAHKTTRTAHTTGRRSPKAST